MNPLSLLLRFLGGLAINATSRMVRAARKSLRPKPLVPPPPIGESGVREYLRGRNDEAYLHAERERLKASANELARKAAQDEGEPEQPSDEVDSR